MAKHRIKFNQDVHVKSGVDGRVLYDYKNGQVVDVEDAERGKWLNRGYAADYQPPPPAAKPPEKQADADSGEKTETEADNAIGKQAGAKKGGPRQPGGF